MISLNLKHSVTQNIILTFLLISGTLKPFLNTFIINFDITIFSIFIVIGDILFSLNKGVKLNKNKVILILIVFLFYAFILFSLIYTKSPKFVYTKTFNFNVNLIYFIYPLFIKEINWKIILKVLLCTILPLSIWFIIYRHLYWTAEFSHIRLKKEGFYHLTSAYLGLGSFLGLSILIVYFLQYKKKLFFILLIVLIASGARGALVFTVFIILIHKLYIFWKVVKKRKTLKVSKKIFTFIFVFLFSLPFYINGLLESSFFKYGLFRIKSLFNFNSDASSLERVNRFDFSMQHIFDTPFSFLFGHGFGSFGVLYINEDKRSYPHNIYLESWFELGLIGLILILLITILPYFLKRNAASKIFTIYFLFNAQKTGSLSDLWILFAFYGILIFNTTKSKNIA